MRNAAAQIGVMRQAGEPSLLHTSSFAARSAAPRFQSGIRPAARLCVTGIPVKSVRETSARTPSLCTRLSTLLPLPDRWHTAGPGAHAGGRRGECQGGALRQNH